MIHDIVKSIVQVMDSGGNSFSFGHTDQSVQNILGDSMSLPVVFLDMPVKFTPEVTNSNFIKYNFDCSIVILYKSTLDDGGGQNESTETDSEQQQIEIFEKALAAQNQFINLLPKSVDVNSYSMGLAYQVQHVFDAELSGIAFNVTIEPKNYAGVCVDGLFPKPNCPTSSYEIIDEDGTVLYIGSIEAGETLITTIDNSTAVLKNSLGTTLSTTSILAEGSEDITAPNAIVVLKNSIGTFIEGVNAVSGTAEDLIAPDADYEVKYLNGTPIESGSIVSNGSKIVEVANPVVCDDANVTLDGATFLTVPSGTTTDAKLVDQNDATITPVSIVGDIVKVNIPEVAGDYNFELFKIATGITDTTILNATSDLVDSLKTNNLWQKLSALYPFVGGTSDTHKYNLIDARDLDEAYRMGFVGTWTHGINGATSDGLTAYGDTNYNPQKYGSIWNEHMGGYIQNNLSNGLIGATQNPTDQILQLGGTLYSSSSGGNLSGAVTADKGLYILNRIVNSSSQTYINGVEVLDLAGGISGYGNQNINYYIACRNNGGVAGFLQANSFSLITIGKGFSVPEITVFNTIINTFQTALSRNV